MAKGVQLATAYISLNVNTNKVRTQIESAFRQVGPEGRAAGTRIGTNLANGLRGSFSNSVFGTALFAPIGVAGLRWAGTAGKAIGTALKTAIVSGVTAGIGAAIFGAGAALVAGLDRLKVLQRADVQLRLKLSQAEINQVKKDITEVVKGTPIALDEAMAAVPRAINAGLRGEELKQYIKDIADLTASTGGQGGFGQLAVILEQVRANGKLAGGEMMQLVDAGVDVRGILKETFGWNDQTLQKNLEKGKVGINELQKAIQKTSPGLARQMGETFEGALGNLRASVARLGANFISAILGKKADEDPLKDFAAGITSITEGLDKVGAWVQENREAIHTTFKTAGDIIGWVADKIGKLPGLFDSAKNGAVSAARWVSEAWERVTTTIGKVKNKVGEVVDSIKTKFTNIMGEVEKKFNSIFGENGWFARQFKKLSDLVDKVRDVLGLGPATATASPGTTPFNPGPKAPSARTPGPGGGTITAQAMPGVSGTLGVPGVSDGINRGPKKSASIAMPSQSVIGSPLYKGDPTQDTGGAVQPRNAILGQLVQELFPGATIGNDYRKPDGFNEHSSGEAADIMVSKLGEKTAEGIALGDKINKWLIENAEKIGLQYTIWKNTLFRPDGSTSPNPGNGTITGDHFDHVHYRVKPGAVDSVPQFGRGGGVWGAGSATSDSIPAMLSNGEHVLSAKDVKAMGGQDQVYAFRDALRKGMIPGFAPGGAVDPNVVQDAENQLADLNKQAEIARARQRELPEDASALDRAQAQIAVDQATRAADQANRNLPIIASGGTPPDMSLENQVLDSTDQLKLAQMALAEAQASDESVPYSRMLELNAAVATAVRDRQQAIEAINQRDQAPNFLDEFMRTGGFLPTAAGNTGVAGTSSLSSIIGMGNEVVGGLIDTGASLLQTAAQAGITAGTMGAGAAAGPAAGAAASYGIQLGASVAKRLSSFGFQLASIGADSLIAQLFPFGAPRAIGYDYTGFMPQLGIQQAALTTIEKMGQGAIQRYFNPNGQFTPPPFPQSPANPATPLNRMEATGAPRMQGTLGVPGVDTSPTPPPPPSIVPSPQSTDNGGGGMGGGAGGGGSWFAPFGVLGRSKGGQVSIYDQGGVLRPGDLALNASTRPERILTDKQWDAMSKLEPSQSSPLVKIDAIYGFSPEDVATQIESKQKLAMMRYAGRP